MRLLVLLLCLGVAAAAPAQTRPATNPDRLRMVWADVDNFWRAYDQLATARNTADSIAIIQTKYLALATPGLRRYAEAAHASAADFLRGVRIHRRYLAAIRPAVQAVGAQKPAVLAAARQLKKMYPAVVFPDLYLCVGKFEVGGTQFDSLLYVGAELKCATAAPPLDELLPALRGGVAPASELSTTCIHEIVHSQQKLANARTNLEGALREGAAEYLAFRITGHLGNPVAMRYGAAHEAAVRRDFALTAAQPIAARWFLALPDTISHQPGALAYFIGYRICEAYYAQAPNKKAALQILVALSDLPALLAVGERYLGL